MWIKKWHLSSREAARRCNGDIIEVIKDTKSKIKYMALLQNPTKLG